MTAATQTAGRAAAVSEEAREACERGLLDTVETRQAATIGLSNALTAAPKLGYAVSRLTRLLFDDRESTREHAAGFVHFVESRDLRSLPELVRAFLASQVFAQNPSGYSMELYPVVLGTSDLEYGLALAMYREGDEPTGSELANKALERNDSPTITARCRELLSASPDQIENELKMPWEVPDLFPRAQKLAPVPRWRDKYPLKPTPEANAPAPAPRSGSDGAKEAPRQPAPEPGPKAGKARLGWPGLFGIFVALF
jgi:hypothetical protein